MQPLPSHHVLEIHHGSGRRKHHSPCIHRGARDTPIAASDFHRAGLACARLRAVAKREV